MMNFLILEHIEIEKRVNISFDEVLGNENR